MSGGAVADRGFDKTELDYVRPVCSVQLSRTTAQQPTINFGTTI